MKWAQPYLRKRPRTPSKGRGPVQRAIRRAFAASDTEVLTLSSIYDWAYVRRRRGRRKSMPFGVDSRTLRIKAQPVKHLFRDVGVAGSNPATPTIISAQK